MRITRPYEVCTTNSITQDCVSVDGGRDPQLSLPVHGSTLMVSQRGKHPHIGKVLLHQLNTLSQDVQLVLSGLVPHVVSWQITSPVYPIKLCTCQ